MFDHGIQTYGEATCGHPVLDAGQRLDRLHDFFRGFPGQEMAGDGNQFAKISAGEMTGVAVFQAGGTDAVIQSVQHDARDRDWRLRLQQNLDRLQRWIAGGGTVVLRLVARCQKWKEN